MVGGLERRCAHFKAMRCSNCRPGSTHGAAASALQPDANQPGDDEWEPKPNEARRWGGWVMVSGLYSTGTLLSSDIVMLEVDDDSQKDKVTLALRVVPRPVAKKRVPGTTGRRG